jgi:hypothetical protein
VCSCGSSLAWMCFIIWSKNGPELCVVSIQSVYEDMQRWKKWNLGHLSGLGIGIVLVNPKFWWCSSILTANQMEHLPKKKNLLNRRGMPWKLLLEHAFSILLLQYLIKTLVVYKAPATIWNWSLSEN